MMLRSGEQEAVGAPGSDLSAVQRQIADEAHRYDFFQAVRLLSRSLQQPTGSKDAAQRMVGHDSSPRQEVVRFRAVASHSFPSGEIASFRPGSNVTSAKGSPAEMAVAFLGLTGPAGALPQHYTQTIIDRVRQKDHSLRDFLDLFNHRSISLFYRAWEKHHLLALLERHRTGGREDPFTRMLYCIVGLGSPGLRERFEIADETFLHYSGLFAHFPRNAISLEQMVTDFCQIPATVRQFQGTWLQLEPPEQSSLPQQAEPLGRNCRLGMDTIAGQRVWSVESKFRIQLGPMDYNHFSQLLPGSSRLTQLGQLVRTYVGPALEFDFQLVLRRTEVPACQLAYGSHQMPRLGWNTWLCTDTKATDAEEAVFVAEGLPTR